MKRTNIHLREDQIDGLRRLSHNNRTCPAHEARVGIDTHLIVNGLLTKQPKKVKSK